MSEQEQAISQYSDSESKNQRTAAMRGQEQTTAQGLFVCTCCQDAAARYGKRPTIWACECPSEPEDRRCDCPFCVAAVTIADLTRRLEEAEKPGNVMRTHYMKRLTEIDKALKLALQRAESAEAENQRLRAALEQICDTAPLKLFPVVADDEPRHTQAQLNAVIGFKAAQIIAAAALSPEGKKEGE